MLAICSAADSSMRPKRFTIPITHSASSWEGVSPVMLLMSTHFREIQAAPSGALWLRGRDMNFITEKSLTYDSSNVNPFLEHGRGIDGGDVASCRWCFEIGVVVTSMSTEQPGAAGSPLHPCDAGSQTHADPPPADHGPLSGRGGCQQNCRSSSASSQKISRGLVSTGLLNVTLPTDPTAAQPNRQRAAATSDLTSTDPADTKGIQTRSAWGSRGPGFKSRQPDSKVQVRGHASRPLGGGVGPSPRNPRAPQSSEL